MKDFFSMSHRSRRRGEGGFTLIELLVVIAVLAILAGIVIFNVVGVSNRGKSSACATDVATIQVAVDANISDAHSDLVAGTMKGTPTPVNGDLAALVSDGYIHSSSVSCTNMSLAGAYATGFTVTGS